LKPENLLLDGTNYIKIADFGYARWMKGNLADTSCGSPAYAAPEVIKGLKYDGMASDIWSCGVILYALLTNRLPFDDEAVRVVLAKVVVGRYDMPALLPDPLKDLIARILITDPSARITIPEMKRHPGFLYGLPDGYTIPTPFPLPSITVPIDAPIDPEFFVTLQAIGYTDDDEIISELLSTEPTRAKVFFQMYDNRMALCSEDDDSPGEPWTRAEIALIEPPDGGAVARSDARAEIAGIAEPLARFMAAMQRYFAALGYDWFHPADVVLLARKEDEGLLVRLAAVFTAVDRFAVQVACLRRGQAACRAAVDAIAEHLAAFVHQEKGG
jgi:hypothetical protein